MIQTTIKVIYSGCGGGGILEFASILEFVYIKVIYTSNNYGDN